MPVPFIYRARIKRKTVKELRIELNIWNRLTPHVWWEVTFTYRAIGVPEGKKVESGNIIFSQLNDAKIFEIKFTPTPAERFFREPMKIIARVGPQIGPFPLPETDREEKDP